MNTAIIEHDRDFDVFMLYASDACARHAFG